MYRNTGNNTISRAASQLNNRIKSRRNANVNAGVNNTVNNKEKRNSWSLSADNTSNRQTIMTILATLLVVIILVASGRWLWRYHRDEQTIAVDTITLLDGANAGNNEFTVSSSQMPSSTYSNEYALSFWMYVDDFNYRRDQDKYILRRGRVAHGTAVNPEIILHPYHNTLEVVVGLQTEKSPSHASQNHHPECDSPISSDSGGSSAVGGDSAASAEGFMNRPRNVHPTKDLSDSYFATIDGVQLVPDSSSGKKHGLALARLHQDHSERFQDSADSSSAAAVPTEEGDVQAEAADTNCPCPCDTVSIPAPPAPLTREEWLKTAARCMVPDFPLQKWVHVVVSQYNQVLDVFIDGHLASSCPMPGFPAISTDNLVLCPDGGFSGRIARVTYSNTSLSASEVHTVYQRGPDSNYKPIRQQVPTWAVATVVLAILLLVALFFM